MFIERKPLLKRFMAKVLKTPTCWVWVGSRHGHGYGHIRIRRKVEKAHRAAWMLFRGPVPVDKHVLHDCDNMWCVKPAHLYLGTPLQNAADRRLRKPNSWAIKFTGKQVRLVAWMCAQPDRLTFRAIGAKFGMSEQYVKTIATRAQKEQPYRTR